MLVIGFSAGGIALVRRILAALPAKYPLSIVLATHFPSQHESQLAQILNEITPLPVCMARDKQVVEPGQVYITPPDYHLLIEKNQLAAPTFALSVDEPVKSVRPSIDVLFQSAAEVYESGLIAVLLSGANSDGAAGIAYVKQLGGLCMVQAPEESEFSTMTRAAIQGVSVDYIASIDDIISLLLSVQET
jgi:two-component system chemotaxis response regulator CheB